MTPEPFEGFHPTDLTIMERMLLAEGYTIQINPDGTKTIIAPDLPPLGGAA